MVRITIEYIMAKPWADQPFKLEETPALTMDKTDPYVHIATEMALIHNCILRGLNAIYQQAIAVESLSDSDKIGFLTFCQCWCEFVHAHHDGEEEILFPRLEEILGEVGIMDVNKDQHKLFHPGLEALADYVYPMCETPEQYDGRELRKIIDTFGEVIRKHLASEIKTLLALKRFGTDRSDDIVKAADDEAQHVMQSVEKTRGFMLAISCLDLEFEGGMHKDFPPAPGPVKFLYSYVFWQGGRDVWKFAPCYITTGKRRELYALEQVPQEEEEESKEWNQEEESTEESKLVSS